MVSEILDPFIQHSAFSIQHSAFSIRHSALGWCVLIERIELRLLRLPLVHFFETSFGRVHDRTFILVSVHGEGAVGLGECVADADPFYSAETTTTAWHIIGEFIAPVVLHRTFAHPKDAFG